MLAPTTRIDVYLERLQSFPSRGREVEEVVFVGQPVKQPGELVVVPRTLADPFALTASNFLGGYLLRGLPSSVFALLDLIA